MVKFAVSVHDAFSMIKVASFTKDSVYTNCDPLYQVTFDNGLLSIFRVSVTFSVSLTTVIGLSSITGLSTKKRNV